MQTESHQAYAPKSWILTQLAHHVILYIYI